MSRLEYLFYTLLCFTPGILIKGYKSYIFPTDPVLILRELDKLKFIGNIADILIFIGGFIFLFVSFLRIRELKMNKFSLGLFFIPLINLVFFIYLLVKGVNTIEDENLETVNSIK